MNSEQIIQKIDEVQGMTIPSARTRTIKQFLLCGKMKFCNRQENNAVLVFFQFLLLSLAAPHALLTQLALVNTQNNPLKFTLALLQAPVDFYRILYACMLTLKMFLILSLYLQTIGQQYIVGVSWLSQQVFAAFGLFKEADLALTAFLCLLNWQENIVFMFISVVICLVDAIYLQNFVIRKNLTYATSFTHYFLFRLILTINYLANVLMLQLGNAQVMRVCCAGWAALVLGWYIRAGHQLYYHSHPRRMMAWVIALLLTFYLKFAENLLLGEDTASFSQLSKLVIIFSSLVLYFSYCLGHSKLARLQDIGTTPIKEIDLSLSKLLESSFANPDCDAELIGLLSFSDQKRDESFYDPFLKCQIKSSDLGSQKQSIMRRYIKHLYLRMISSEDMFDRGRNDIDYCEYICNYDHNYYEAHKILTLVRSRSLHLLDRVKVERLQCMLQESSGKLGQQIYNGTLQVEKVIKSQQCYRQIQRNIYKYITHSITIWEMLKLHDISLLEFRYLLKASFKSIELINEGWKEISSFFPINRRWSYVYSQYQYYIKNEKVKHKQIDLFRNSTGVQSVFDYQPIHFTERSQDKELYSPELIFNEDSFFLRVGYELGELIIKEGSKRFLPITGYTTQEAAGSPVSVLMCDDLKDSHTQKFSTWMQKGLVSNENAYSVKRTQLLTKEKLILPVLKYIKVYYNIQTGIDFFCMIKINQQPPKMKEQSPFLYSTGTVQLNTSPNINEHKMQNQFAPSCDELVDSNIFVKEEMLLPRPTFREIRHFKIVSRLFLVLIVSSIIVLVMISNNNSNNLSNYSNQFINYMSMYRFPVVLSTNLMKNFLSVGNQTKVKAQIKSATTGFLTNSQTELTKITLFDPLLNPPNTYYPYYNYSFLSNQSQSEIDLFYLISSSISSLSLQLPVNRTSKEYQTFTSYLKPAYDDMMNTTKFLLHSQFSTIFSFSISNQTLFIFIQSSLFLVFVIAMFLCIHLFIIKMKNILFIILDLDPSHIHTACNYWKRVKDYFDLLFQQDDLECSSSGSDKYINKYKEMREAREKEKTSLNKRSKQIHVDRERRCFQLKLRAIIVASMAIILAISVSIEASTISQLKKLAVFEEAGFFFLKYFPCGPLVTMGCTQKYYADQYPNQVPFRPQKYDDVLGSMYIFGNLNNYIGQIEDPSSAYFAKRKNYFFGNPCSYNPAILVSAGITVAKCESMSNGTFKEGLSAFLRYGQRMGKNCIYGNVNLTAAQLDEFTLGGTILSAYVLDAITTWVSEFASKVLVLQDNNQIHCLLIVLAIVAIHILVNEMRTLSIIQEEYCFVSKAYECLVPEGVLLSEKVVRQKFIIEGIIRS